MSLPKLKAFLTLLMAIGAAAFFGGGSTFASFSAETTNAGSTASSGTLTMSNTVGGGTACSSYGGTAQDNFNELCDPVLTATNMAPGVYAQTAEVTIQNTGSIDASALSLWAPSATTNLDAAVADGAAVTSLTVTPLERPVAAGDSIVVGTTPNTQTFTASQAAAAGDTTIDVTSDTASMDFPVGSTVADSSAPTTDCADAQTDDGAALGFNPTAGNPLCSQLLLYVQETTGGLDYCWYGNTDDAPSGGCTAPISVSPQDAITAGNAPGSITLGGTLNGNVKDGDTLQIVDGDVHETFTASADAYFGASSIAASGWTPANSYAAGTATTITDLSSLNKLNIDQTDTVSSFDTAHDGATGKIPLYPLTANDVADGDAPVALAAAATRTFEVGVFLPGPEAIDQNPLQGLESTFGLTWRLDQ